MESDSEQQDTMTDVQKISSACLERIDDFCRRQGIRYFLLGGTLIGAVRHQGPIPWDDDVDIGMPRPDYEQFVKQSVDIGYPYIVSHPMSDPSYVYPYAKCYDTNTTVVEHTYSNGSSPRNFVRGVWVDVFPIDGTFDHPLCRFVHLCAVRWLVRARRIKQGVLATDRSKRCAALKRVVKLLVRPTITWMPLRWIDATLQWILTLKPYGSSHYAGNLLGAYGRREVCVKAVFEGVTEFDYAGQRLPGPKLYDRYLRQIYGDYMRIPDAADRVAHHIEVISLTHGFVTTGQTDI